MAACGGGERAGRLVDEEDEAVVGGEGGGVVFLRQLPEVGDAVTEGSDGGTEAYGNESLHVPHMNAYWLASNRSYTTCVVPAIVLSAIFIRLYSSLLFL